MPAPLSARNPRIATLRRLSRRRRARLDAGLFVVEGPVALAEALAGGAPVREVYVDADALAGEAEGSALRAAVAAAEAAGVVVHLLADGVLEGVADTATPQGVLAVAERRPADLATLSSRPGPVLVLVGVADPGNTGTLVRTAEAAGAAGVVVCGGTDPFGPKAVRAAAGSVFRVPVVEVPEADGGASVGAVDALAALKVAGRAVLGTVARHGTPPDAADLTGPVAVVLGSEAQGLPADVEACLDGRLTIPMAGAIESLNVAVAGAVVLFEAARQRRTAAVAPSANQLDGAAGNRQARAR